MDEAVDAAGLAQFAIRVGLLDDHTAREALYELGRKDAAASELVALLTRRGQLTPLQGGKLLKGDTGGYFLGGYRILYKISSGTFGRVYRGDDPRTGQVVAVKVLRHKWTDNKQKVDQFMREGRVGMTLQHPHVVGMLAVNKDANTGQYFIVMEFVEGDNLRNILGIRGKLEPDEALRMMEECAQGLVYAFSRGLTHRDIKPTNILVSTDKLTKLVDFGLAEMSAQSDIGGIQVGRNAEKDEDVAIDRTLDYAGLEKATGVTKGDIRSDIYFLGHVLYEMMAGEPLMAVTRDKNVKMQPRRYMECEAALAKRGPEVGLPPEAQRLIAKAVAFEPHLRYQSPAAFLEAIKTCRAEMSGATEVDRAAPGVLTIYCVEQHPKLQDAFRDRFKQIGFRVLMSGDATNALRRYQTAPYHALLIDAGTAGRDGVDTFEKVLREAEATGLDLCGMLLLNEDQAVWADAAVGHAGAEVFVRPVGLKQLVQHMREQMPGLSEEATTSG